MTAKFYRSLGRVGEATWVLVKAPTGFGILTVGPRGRPQVTLTPWKTRPTVSTRGSHIWFAEAKPNPRLLGIDVSDALSPKVGATQNLPFKMPEVEAFAVGPTLAVFVADGKAYIMNRRTKRWRVHQLATDAGNFGAHCFKARCHVYGQTELTKRRLRLRHWVFASLLPPKVTLVADEPAHSVRSIPIKDALWLVWSTPGSVLRARRVEPSGRTPDPVVALTRERTSSGGVVALDGRGPAFLYTLYRTAKTYRVSLGGRRPGPAVQMPLERAGRTEVVGTSEGGLYITAGGGLEGMRRRRSHGHRWRFSARTLFWSATKGRQPSKELFSKSGGGLFTVTAVPIAGPGGFAAVFSFAYHPWAGPTFWVLRKPCEGSAMPIAKSPQRE